MTLRVLPAKGALVVMLSLVERTGLDANARKQLLRFMGITERIQEHLSQLGTFFEEIAGVMVSEFYHYLLAHPETAAFLEDPELVARLKEAQKIHFVGLAKCSDDEAYFESRLRVGMTHARVNVGPQWYLGAYSVQVGTIVRELFARYYEEPERLTSYMDAVNKVITLDICLATHAYIYGGFIERSLAEAHRREAERAKHALVDKEREEERKEELLRMVVHDIRSPVTAIMATARAALRRYDDLSTVPGKQFRLIEESGSNVLNIIDDIFTVARASKGEMPVFLEAFDVAELIEDCLSELRPYAQQTGHSVSREGETKLPVKALDKLLVRRIISNLLVNAFRHTPAGVSVRVSCEPGDGGRCIVRVADNGPGIAPRVAERLFEDRSDGELRSAGASIDTGLGLPFCRLACQRLGGSICLDDSSGPGACFVIELPTE